MFLVSAKSKLTTKRNIKSYFYSKLRPKYNAVWKTEIFNDRHGKQYGNKLRTYRLFKNNFTFESYLDLDKFNRNILIRFRTYIKILKFAYQLFLFCLCRASERSRHSDSKVDEVLILDKRIQYFII
jgi:hypothetical protein